MAVCRFPLYPVSDRGRLALQYVAMDHFRTVTRPLQHLRLRPAISCAACLHRPSSRSPNFGLRELAVRSISPWQGLVLRVQSQRAWFARDAARGENARGSCGPRGACLRRYSRERHGRKTRSPSLALDAAGLYTFRDPDDVSRRRGASSRTLKLSAERRGHGRIRR